MKKLMILLTFLIFCVVQQNLNAQLINVESRRMQTDSIRFALKNDFNLSLTNNNNDPILSITNSLTTQAKTKDLKKILLLSGNYKLIRASNQDFANIWLLHLRYNYKVTKKFRLESFVQTQYDGVLDVSNRNLIGIGIRLKLMSSPYLNIYLGNSYMYEYEGSDKFESEDYYHRNSAYISLTANIPNTKLGIVNTCYFQPLYENLDDYRFLEEFKLDYKINKYINFFSRFTYYRDNITPNPDAKSQFSSSTQFGLGIAI